MKADSQTEETGKMTSENFSQPLMWTSGSDLVGRLAGVHSNYFCLIFSVYPVRPLLCLYIFYAFPSQGPSTNKRALVELGSMVK